MKKYTLACTLMALCAFVSVAYGAEEWFEIGEYCPKLKDHGDYWREQWPYKDIADPKRGSSYLKDCTIEINAYWKDKDNAERADHPLHVVLQDKEDELTNEMDNARKVEIAREIRKIKADIDKELASTFKENKATKEAMVKAASKVRGQS